MTVRSLISEQEERRNRIADAVLLKPFSLKDLQRQVTTLMNGISVLSPAITP